MEGFEYADGLASPMLEDGGNEGNVTHAPSSTNYHQLRLIDDRRLGTVISISNEYTCNGKILRAAKIRVQC